MNILPELKIEQLRADDIPAVLDTFMAWHKTQEQFEGYLAEQERGERTVFLAWLDGRAIGWINVLWKSRYEALSAEHIGQVEDLKCVEELTHTKVDERLCCTAAMAAKQRGIYGFIADIESFDFDTFKNWSMLGFFPVLFDNMEQMVVLYSVGDYIKWSSRISIRGDFVFSDVEPLDFLASLGSELSSPANSIMGFAMLMKRGFLPDDVTSLANIADTIQSNARKILTIIELNKLYVGMQTRKQHRTE